MPDSSLPSKQFIIRGGIAIGIISIILIVQTNWFHSIFQKKTTPQTPGSATLSDIVSHDSNGNGIPDWEERLWGLDPTVLYTDGKSNAEIIKEKKEALGVTDPTASTPTNQTDIIAQKLFSISTALSQNPNIDDATLQSVANQLGSSVNVSVVSNTYSLKSIHLVATSTASLTKYNATLTSILSKYDLSQNDISIIVNAVETGDYSQLPQLTPIGASYTALAKELSLIPVPIGVAQYHLDIINSFAGINASFSYLSQMEDNGTEALVGVALYKVYSTRGQQAFYDLHNYLVKYGILSS
jgi:hypothetical protein